jgi:tetratricopeptide (TPR) repeat protein
MAKHAAHRTACFAILFSLSLCGCAMRGPVLSGTGGTELRDTPFFPQTRYQCGPAALATTLAASGVPVTAEELAGVVYIPERRGSLQVEMQAAPRAYGRLALRLPRNLEAIVAELEAGRPVLVLHNYGLSFWPRWHYAVVIGYDATKDHFVLRSGRQQRKEMRTRHFMVYWHHAGRWATVLLRPGETAANGDATAYLESAADFERGSPPEAVRAAFDAAVKRWPDEPVAFIGRGTAEYRLGNPGAAARDYAEALRLDPAQVGARNNLAQALLDLKCPQKARAQLATIDLAALREGALRAAVLDTLSRANQAQAPDSSDCPPIP